MKVIRKVNNNVAICLDNDGNELIAFGIGIGFPKLPYELTDMSKVSRTYYDINPNFLVLFKEIPEEVFEMAMVIVDYAKTKIMNEMNSNIVFTLADHINFTIERYKKNLMFNIPFTNDVQHLYEIEMEIGEKAIEYINTRMQMNLPKNEAVSIAIHFINSENLQSQQNQENEIVSDITDLIEDKMEITINKDSFNYSRFVSHLQYLLKRQESNEPMISENSQMFSSIKEKYQTAYECVLDIKAYVNKNLKWDLNDEELLYLMLHVNRLCTREEHEQ